MTCQGGKRASCLESAALVTPLKSYQMGAGTHKISDCVTQQISPLRSRTRSKRFQIATSCDFGTFSVKYANPALRQNYAREPRCVYKLLSPSLNLTIAIDQSSALRFRILPRLTSPIYPPAPQNWSLSKSWEFTAVSFNHQHVTSKP